MIIKHTSRCWKVNPSPHSKQEYCSETEKSRKTWQSSAACILTPWELQTTLRFYIKQHMEVILYSDSNVLFQTACQPFFQLVFSYQCSLREKSIHHCNGALDAVIVNCRMSQKTTHNQDNTCLWAFPGMTNSMKS